MEGGEAWREAWNGWRHGKDGSKARIEARHGWRQGMEGGKAGREARQGGKASSEARRARQGKVDAATRQDDEYGGKARSGMIVHRRRPRPYSWR